MNLIERGGPGAATLAIYLDKKLFPEERFADGPLQAPEPPAPQGILPTKKTFSEFCTAAGYPAPYPKQVEMRDFGCGGDGARLLLGSRGYGKTDYVLILGHAYEIYLDPTYTLLFITKSDQRNAAILHEMANALKINGVILEKESAREVRVQGLIGKDHSISAVTVGTKSLRGRHPRKIVMDDPVTEEDVSAATRKRVKRLYDESSKLTARILLIGQPAHKFDLYEELRPQLEKMEVPHGSIPELDHDLEAQRLAGVSEESIQASYHLKVMSESGFPFEKVKSLDDLPSGPGVAFLDPSHEGGDYTALSIFKGYFDNMAVKGHVWKKAWNHCLDDMVPILKAAGVKRLCVETNGLGDQPVIMLRQALPDDIGVVGRKSTNYKHSRILAAGAYAERIYLVKTSDRIYKEHVVKYEYGAEFDDAPDSLATGLEWIGLVRGKLKS